MSTIDTMPKEIPPCAARWSSGDVNRETLDPHIDLNAQQANTFIQEKENHVKDDKAPAQENETSDQKEEEGAKQGKEDHGNTGLNKKLNIPRQTTFEDWIRLLQVYQVYKFLAYRHLYDAHTDQFTFQMKDNYFTWRRYQFIDGLATYWRRFWNKWPCDELSNAPLEWESEHLSGTEHDEILRANIENILLDNMEGKSLQDAVKDAWTFFVSEKNRHPWDSFWYMFWMERWHGFSEEQQQSFLSTFNCDPEAIND
jgi:hypothetical protein